MPLEVRQLTIKSQVRQLEAESHHDVLSGEAVERLKEEIREECRQLIIDVLRKERER